MNDFKRRSARDSQSSDDSSPSEEEITIVELQPGSSESPLEVLLNKYKLQEILFDFEAVTSVWHMEECNIAIRCAQTSLRITPSLEKALRRLRSLTHTRMLWIDHFYAEPLVEQPRSLRKLYGTASKMIIWLGEDDDKINRAVSVIEVLAQFYHDHLHEDVETRNSRFEGLYSANPAYRESLAAVGALTHHPWFHQNWIYQKIHLSNSVEILVGPKTLTWQVFSNAIMAAPVWLLVDEIINSNVKFLVRDDPTEELSLMFQPGDITAHRKP